jgi:uncharacterized repeat protein (TIGR01451 family)
MTRRKQVVLNLLVVLALMLSVIGIAPVAATPSDAALTHNSSTTVLDAVPAAQATEPSVVSQEEALQKIHPQLREIAQTAAPNLPGVVGANRLETPINIMVTAIPGIDLSAYMTHIVPTRVLFEGEQDFYGQTQPALLIKIASLADVMTIIPVTDVKDGPSPISPEDTSASPAPRDWATLRANATALRASLASRSATVRSIFPNAPDDWFEIMIPGPHKAEAAWARGFDGTGVTVQVNDDGVDWGHPDLMGLQKIYSTTLTGGTSACGPKGCAGAYNGWPMAFSPLSLYLYVRDSTEGTHFTANGQSSDHYVDTSETPVLEDVVPGVKSFTFTPLIDYATPGFEHTFLISNTMSKSGVVHVGTHPDESLRDFVWGEKVAVLVTDPNTAGVYDTVYVDLNDDYDFRDERPLTKADTTNATTLEATKNNMIAYRDLTGDGKADVSGGALYFIADGVTPLPHAWVKYVAWAAPAPGNGNLVAFDGPWASGYSHGTQCASNVVGQGQVNGLLPSFSDLPGDGKPSGAVFGAAKNARLVDVSNIYYDFTNSKISAYTFSVYGYDGQRSTLANGTINAADTDGIQMASNSYGSSDADNDGWDYDGRYVSRRVRLYGRYLSNLDSTGNGAPAYGTTTPPSGDTSISVGASTQYGSTGWDSITSTTQIMFNDVAWYSNRGPSARGNAGVDVVADGQRGAGDEALNYYSASTWGELDGNRSWATWGGTSRSAPAAMGNLALFYQAFKTKNGRWPWYDEAKALFKSTATDLNYDVLTQGSGSVNSDRGTAVAAGWYGLYVTPDEWNPGAFRGTNAPAFAHVMTPTQTAAQNFVIKNTGVATITASVVQGDPTLISSKTFTYTVTPAMVAALSTDTFQSPQIIIPITATASKIVSNSWWSNIAIPSDTQLMLITARLPYSQYDADGDYEWDNRFRLTAYNWKDVNGNGKVWTDKNSNGVVNYSLSPNVTIDGFQDPNWSAPANEIDRWEYGRFDYARPGSDVYQLPIHDPVARMQDGLFLGLNRYPASTITNTNLTFRIDFYKYASVPWLSMSASSLEVAPGMTATLAVTATTNNTAAGVYEAAIKIIDPGATNITGTVNLPGGGTGFIPQTDFPAHTAVVPIAMTVAPDFSEGMTFGGAAQAAAQSASLYNNGVVRGYFDWTWRAESGDWRFFFFDNKTTPPASTNLIVKNEWASAAPHTDIDTIIMGPTNDCFSYGDPTNPTGACNSYKDPAYYGPYTLATKGKSQNANAHDGVWQFNTSTGHNEDWVTAPFANGLHAVLDHNVLFEGDKFDVVFTQTVGTLTASTTGIELYTYSDAGSQQVVVQSGLSLPGMVADAYGLGGPTRYSWPMPFTGAGTLEYTTDFTVTHAAKIDISVSSPDISDVDIYLYRKSGTSWVLIGSSAGGSADEQIIVNKPADGVYKLAVDNFSGPAGTVDAVFTIVQGTDLSVTGTTTNTIPANTPITLTVAYNKIMNPGDTYQGSILLGPTTAPGALSIPVTIHRLSDGGMLTKKAASNIVLPGGLITYTIQAQNTSQPTATFTIQDVLPAHTTFVTATNGAVQAGGIVTWTGLTSGDVSYEWRDSLGNRSTGTTLGPVAFDWIDIKSLGTQLDVNDGYDTEVTLPFAFKFDGVDYSDFRVSDDGLLSFVNYLTAADIGSIPEISVTEPFIGPFISDLWPGGTLGTNGVWYTVVGTAPNRMAVFQWNALDIPNYNDNLEFEAVLYEGTNQIKFQYNNISYAQYWGTTGLTGIQLDDTRGYDYGSTYAPRDFLALLYSPIYPSATFDLVVQADNPLAAYTVIMNTATLRIDHVLAQAGQTENFSASASVTVPFVAAHWIYLPVIRR